MLRGSRGDAAGLELGSSFVERIAVNTGTVPVCPVPRGQRGIRAGSRCRPTGPGRGGAAGGTPGCPRRMTGWTGPGRTVGCCMPAGPSWAWTSRGSAARSRTTRNRLTCGTPRCSATTHSWRLVGHS